MMLFVLAGSIECKLIVPPVLPEFLLDMFLKTTEMDIQLMEVFQKGT